MVGSNELSTFSLGMLFNHEESTETRCPKLNLKIVTNDDKRTNNPKSILSKMCWNNMIQVQNLNNKRVDSEMKSRPKKCPTYYKVSKGHKSLGHLD